LVIIANKHGQTYRAFHGFGQAQFCLWWFDFSLEPIYTGASAASKNDAWFKRGQNNQLPSLI